MLCEMGREEGAGENREGWPSALQPGPCPISVSRSLRAMQVMNILGPSVLIFKTKALTG